MSLPVHDHPATAPNPVAAVATAGDSVGSEQIAALLARRGARLRFPDAGLEQGFRRFAEFYHLVQVRFALLVLMVLVGVFGFADLYNFPREVAQRTLALRLGLVLPVLVFVYWRTFKAGGAQALHPYLMLAATVAGLGGVAMVYLPHAAGVLSPYEGLMLFMFGIGGFMGLRFAYALALLVLMTALYVASELLAGAPAAYLANSGFRIACTAIVGSFAAYIVERQARQVYLQRVLLERHAHRDGLTGLANRRAFDLHAARVAQQAARDGQPLSLLIVDVDHFKQYNDTYGHLMGDRCLQQLAGALADSARRPLDMAARYGGEEFVLVWFGVGVAESQRLAAGLQARIEQLALDHAGAPSGGAANVCVSGGIATRLAGDARPLAQWIADADQALYAAKAGGRNRIVHAAEMVAGAPGASGGAARGAGAAPTSTR